MADRYLLESGSPDGYLLEDGTGVYLLDPYIRFIGYETGDAKEIPDGLVGAATVQSTTVITGAYSLKCVSDSAGQKLLAPDAVRDFGFSFRFRFDTNPSANRNIANFAKTGNDNIFILRLTTARQLRVAAGGGSEDPGITTTTGATVLNANQNYTIQFEYDNTAGGIIKVWLDGVLEIDITHSNATTTISSIPVDGPVSGDGAWFYDDCYIVNTLIQPPAVRVICRQGNGGTPTYDTWTKNGAATAALCWSDTPANTATNCSTTAQNTAQTMKITSFGATQSGHGTETFTGEDTIHGCKYGVFHKEGANVVSISGRRRTAGVDTDTAMQRSTTDRYDEIYFAPPTFADLIASEFGEAVGAISGGHTAVGEDIWSMAAYTLSTIRNPTATVATSAQAIAAADSVALALALTLAVASQAVAAALQFMVSATLATSAQAIAGAAAVALSIAATLASAGQAVAVAASVALSAAQTLATPSQAISAVGAVALSGAATLATSAQTIAGELVRILSATITTAGQSIAASPLVQVAVSAALAVATLVVDAVSAVQVAASAALTTAAQAIMAAIELAGNIVNVAATIMTSAQAIIAESAVSAAVSAMIETIGVFISPLALVRVLVAATTSVANATLSAIVGVRLFIGTGLIAIHNAFLSFFRASPNLTATHNSSVLLLADEVSSAPLVLNILFSGKVE